MFCEICKCFVVYLRIIFIISLAAACKMRYTIKEKDSHDHFLEGRPMNEPLAQRLRPKTLADVCGQQHLLA